MGYQRRRLFAYQAFGARPFYLAAGHERQDSLDAGAAIDALGRDRLEAAKTKLAATVALVNIAEHA